ncbi:MAG: N-acetylmuramoyl-L-alanine amidase [Rhodospirillales bacterium]
MARGFEVDPDAMGIEGPAYSPPTAAAQAWARAQALSPEYALATQFAASPAYTRLMAPRAISRVIIHITDAPTTASTVSHFTRPDANSSAHYLVGQDGAIIQFVRENDIAWHARGANSDSIGIEHVCVKEGGVTYGNTTFQHLPPTDAQYCGSAALVSYLCLKYGIPIDRQHIIGHVEADPNTKHRFTLNGAPFMAIAGLWRDGKGNQPPAFTMLTTQPGPDVKPIHNRQVVVLRPEDWPAWIYLTKAEADLLQPLAAGSLQVEMAQQGLDV